METVAIALIATVPPTLAALAAWRKSSGVQGAVGERNGRGTAQDQLGRLEDKVDAVLDWQLRHLERHHRR